ncbi:hypothetical protein BDK51DRAFT_27984, partial [Blyttiomyces helicus]
TCVLCPYKDGALKQVESTDQWVHLVCTWWIAEADLEEKRDKKGISLLELDPKRWKMVSCDAHGCKKSMHCTCAANYGLLEEDDDEAMEDPFFSYCKEHATSESPRLNAWATWVKEKHQILAKFAPTTPTPPDPRAILEDAWAAHDRTQREDLARLTHDICRLAAEHTDLDTSTDHAREEMDRMDVEIAAIDADMADVDADGEALRCNLLVLLGAMPGATAAAGKGGGTDTIDVIAETILKAADLTLAVGCAAPFLEAYRGGMALMGSDPTAAASSSASSDASASSKGRTASRRGGKGGGKTRGGGCGKAKRVVAPAITPYARPAAPARHQYPSPPLPPARASSGICDVCKTFEGVPAASHESGSLTCAAATKKPKKVIECTDCLRVYHWGCTSCDTSDDSSDTAEEPPQPLGRGKRNGNRRPNQNRF